VEVPDGPHAMITTTDSDTMRMIICFPILVVWSTSGDALITLPVTSHLGDQELFKIPPHQPVSGYPAQ
jgi:uncharacterized ion transporter superfamily protein YfcC